MLHPNTQSGSAKYTQLTEQNHSANKHNYVDITVPLASDLAAEGSSPFRPVSNCKVMVTARSKKRESYLDIIRLVRRLSQLEIEVFVLLRNLVPSLLPILLRSALMF